MPTYVYGITPADASALDERGIDGGGLRTLTEDRLAAIVGTIEHDPVEANRANLMTHSDVLQEAVDAGPLVPMRFGTVLDDDQAVVDELLRRRRDDLAALLDTVGQHVELSLSAYYVEDAILREIVASTPAIARLQASIRSVPEAATYYERIRLGELVSGELARRRAADASALFELLKPLALETRAADDLPDRTVLRASFLVTRDAVERFRDAVEAAARDQDARMTLKLTGPLPPFSFVDVDAGTASRGRAGVT